MRKPRTCCSCRAGLIRDVPADGLYAGKVYDDDLRRWRPFRGWLCDTHAEVHAMNGDILRRVRAAPETAA